MVDFDVRVVVRDLCAEGRALHRDHLGVRALAAGDDVGEPLALVAAGQQGDRFGLLGGAFYGVAKLARALDEVLRIRDASNDLVSRNDSSRR